MIYYCRNFVLYITTLFLILGSSLWIKKIENQKKNVYTIMEEIASYLLMLQKYINSKQMK